jgi:N-acyl-D-aspartate/D-glutamate deacylase
MGLFRKALKTSVLTMMDIRADRFIYRLAGWLARFTNKVLRADFKWQALPELFDLWADGFDLVVFEEFGAGAAVLHYQKQADREKLLRDPEYRTWFRKQWRSKFLPKAFHRNLDYSKVLSCPDASLVGKSFKQIAEERGKDDIDTFLDLIAEHGTRLRWYTVMANDRPEPLKYIVKHPDSMMGFSDAGAHLRQMAHYNFPLRMLKLVRDAELEGKPFMTVERAVQKVTSELADWLGIDAGHLEEGKRADIALIDPERLDEQVNLATEAPMPGIEGFSRMVRRNDSVVNAVWVNGKLAVRDGNVLPEVGKQKGFGRVLRGANAKDSLQPKLKEEISHEARSRPMLSRPL